MVDETQKLNKIKESEVEEALVSDLRIIKTLLYLPTEPRLIARQLQLEDGSRLDLLMSSGDFLFLIELKVTKYFPEHKEQILRYKNQIEQLQVQKELPVGDVKTPNFEPSG